MRIKKVLITLTLLIFVFLTKGQNLSEEEIKLYELVMEYRAKNGLPSIPLSVSLTKVAKAHVEDLQVNKPVTSKCNLHSWSDKGPWMACCYTNDHANANCMWSKPRELTSYKGNGYEISFWTSGSATATQALNGWKTSSGHNSVIINAGIWNKKWNAIGVGLSENYAVVWFGHELDN